MSFFDILQRDTAEARLHLTGAVHAYARDCARNPPQAAACRQRAHAGMNHQLGRWCTPLTVNARAAPLPGSNLPAVRLTATCSPSDPQVGRPSSTSSPALRSVLAPSLRSVMTAWL